MRDEGSSRAWHLSERQAELFSWDHSSWLGLLYEPYAGDFERAFSISGMFSDHQFYNVRSSHDLYFFGSTSVEDRSYFRYRRNQARRG